MAISVKRYDPFTTILPVILQTLYILATFLNLSFNVLENNLFLANLSKKKFLSKSIFLSLNNIKNNTWLESTIFFLISRGNNKVSILTKNVTYLVDSASYIEKTLNKQNSYN